MLGDSGVAAGVRRLEALTATAARRHLNAAAAALQGTAATLKVSVPDVEARVAALVDERRSWSAN